MKCPIDEIVMVDYLESCLEPGLAGDVRRHLECCPVCAREYEELVRVRKFLADTTGEHSDEPPESFWTESARAVAEATYLQPAKLERSWAGRFSRPAVYGSLAAAAMLVLAITWLFQPEAFRPGPGKGPALAERGTEASEQAALASVSSEQALVDSIQMLWQEMQEYELAAQTLDSYYALELQEDNQTAGEEFPFSTGLSVYDGLRELNEDQLQKVMFLVASY